MLTPYKILTTQSFDQSYITLIRKDKNIKQRIDKTLKLLKNDPFYPSLKTHKVQSRLYGEQYSSRVTGDIRIIWNFDKDNKLYLILLDIGGHSGTKKVYQ